MNLPKLQPSRLGTQEYWDSVYRDEIHNLHELGEEGEIWFGIDSVEKMVDWTLKYVEPLPTQSILEVGMGNGNLLLALAEAGYPQSALYGIDYSADAVKLASAIALDRQFEGIAFHVGNFLKQDPPPPRHVQPEDARKGWDLILDKGTYDAIALMEEEHGVAPGAGYPEHVASLLKPGGYFLITSCNFTEEELDAIFITPETGMVRHSRIHHPTFTFGGKTGSTISTIAFQKPSQPEVIISSS